MSDVYASSQPKKTVKKIFNPLWSHVLTLESFNCKKRITTAAPPPPLTIKFPAAPPCERDTLIAVKIGLPLAKRNAGRSGCLKQRLRGFDGAEPQTHQTTLCSKRTLIIAVCPTRQRVSGAYLHRVEREEWHLLTP